MTLPIERKHSHDDYEIAAKNHLDRLVAGCGLLADLSFSDLLLYVPRMTVQRRRSLHTHVDGSAMFGRTGPDYSTVGGEGLQFVDDSQVRPTTGQTLLQNDLVGRVFDAQDLPLVHEAWLTGQIV